MNENEQMRARCTLGAVYVVQEGDTFAAIAQRYGVTAGELSELNPYTDVERLNAGQLLCVPSDDGEKTDPEPAETPAPADACPEGYEEGVVQAGETYADILRRYDISSLAFRLSNPRLHPDALKAGQRYCVPPEELRRVCPGGESRTLAAGETLDTLARALNVTPGRLLRLNPGLSPSDFREGQKVCVATS